MNTTPIKFSKRHQKRLKQIFRIFRKYHLDALVPLPDWISKGNELIQKYVFKSERAKLPREKLVVNIRLAIEELGPTFVKFGQIMSMRPDITPPDIIKELERLRDNVLPFPINEVREIIRTDLKKPIEQIYSMFEEVPTASASIAQVHKARVDGIDVAVKIRRPGIRAIIEDDCLILMYIANLMQKIPEFRRYDPVGIVREFEMQLLGELSFDKEIANSQKFYDLYETDPTIKIPKVYKQYSSNRIITMEFITGMKLTEYLKKEKDIQKRKEMAERVGVIALDQVFYKKLFHADPHPGNIFLIGDVICFLDFGVVKFITESQKKSMQKLVLGIFTSNTEMVTESIFEMTDAPISMFDAINSDVEYLLEKYAQTSLGSISISDFSVDIIDIVNQRDLSIPASYTQMIKTLTIVEGICVELYPEFNIMDVIRPFFDKKKQTTIDDVKKTSVEIAGSYLDMFSILPKKIKNLTKSIENKDIEMKIVISNMDEMQSTMNKVSNSFVFGIITGSIIMGSSIILNSKIPPLFDGVSVLGITGYAIAGVMGVIYLLSVFIEIIKHSKKH